MLDVFIVDSNDVDTCNGDYSSNSNRLAWVQWWTILLQACQTQTWCFLGTGKKLDGTRLYKLSPTLMQVTTYSMIQLCCSTIPIFVYKLVTDILYGCAIIISTCVSKSWPVNLQTNTWHHHHMVQHAKSRLYSPAVSSHQPMEMVLLHFWSPSTICYVSALCHLSMSPYININISKLN